MKADYATPKGLFSNDRQYLVPLFQRSYAWGMKEWKTLWQDVRLLPELEASRQHYIGAVVMYLPITLWSILKELLHSRFLNIYKKTSTIYLPFTFSHLCVIQYETTRTTSYSNPTRVVKAPTVPSPAEASGSCGAVGSLHDPGEIAI